MKIDVLVKNDYEVEKLNSKFDSENRKTKLEVNNEESMAKGKFLFVCFFFFEKIKAFCSSWLRIGPIGAFFFCSVSLNE